MSCWWGLHTSWLLPCSHSFIAHRHLPIPPACVQAWFAKGSSGGSRGRKGEKRKGWELLVPSSKEAERGLVQVVFQLEESPRTRVWMKPGFFLPKKEYKMEMEVNVNKSG